MSSAAAGRERALIDGGGWMWQQQQQLEAHAQAMVAAGRVLVSDLAVSNLSEGIACLICFLGFSLLIKTASFRKQCARLDLQHLYTSATRCFLFLGFLFIFTFNSSF
jgi:hypothetical protein